MVVVDLFGKPDCSEDINADEADESDLNDSLLGRYAEFIVCAQICKAGFLATHVDSVGFDLVITTEEGSFTVQVKSTSRIINGRCKWGVKKAIGGGQWKQNRKWRRVTAADTDLLALFHHVYETTIIVPVIGICPRVLYFPVSQVENASIASTLEPALAYLKRNIGD